jgi:hypothetical protein
MGRHIPMQGFMRVSRKPYKQRQWFASLHTTDGFLRPEPQSRSSLAKDTPGLE